MAYRSFRHFLETLEQAGELIRIADPVDTNLLIAEWADREMKSANGGKALLFEQPVVDGQGSKFPVAINTMGSRKRIAMALGRESIDEIAQEIQLILKAKPPTDRVPPGMGRGRATTGPSGNRRHDTLPRRFG